MSLQLHCWAFIVPLMQSTQENFLPTGTHAIGFYLSNIKYFIQARRSLSSTTILYYFLLKELKLKDEQCEKLSRVRNELEAELEELTASLFQVCLE